MTDYGKLYDEYLYDCYIANQHLTDEDWQYYGRENHHIEIPNRDGGLLTPLNSQPLTTYQHWVAGVLQSEVLGKCCFAFTPAGVLPEHLDNLRSKWRTRNSIKVRASVIARTTPEERRESSLKAKATMGPERRREAGRKAQASRTPEERSEITRKGHAAQTPEQRRERMMKVHGWGTPEERSESRRQAQARRTVEERRASALKAAAKRTAEERSNTARKREEAQTPEQRSERNRKGWETRRRKAKGR